MTSQAAVEFPILSDFLVMASLTIFACMDFNWARRQKAQTSAPITVDTRKAERVPLPQTSKLYKYSKALLEKPHTKTQNVLTVGGFSVEFLQNLRGIKKYFCFPHYIFACHCNTLVISRNSFFQELHLCIHNAQPILQIWSGCTHSLFVYHTKSTALESV